MGAAAGLATDACCTAAVTAHNRPLPRLDAAAAAVAAAAAADTAVAAGTGAAVDLAKIEGGCRWHSPKGIASATLAVVVRVRTRRSDHR